MSARYGAFGDIPCRRRSPVRGFGQMHNHDAFKLAMLMLMLALKVQSCSRRFEAEIADARVLETDI